MKKYTIIPVLFLIALAFYIAEGLKDLRFPSYTAATYTESAAVLDNPYIGWYKIYGYVLTDADDSDSELPSTLEYGPGLVMLQFNLRNYTQSIIGSAALQQLDNVLYAWSSKGKQLIVRFLYDWSGDAVEREPESLSLVLEHMTQTAEVINRYSNHIYIMQGLFVGAWGEMHNSNYMDEENMLTLVDHLAAVTDPNIFLAVRTPEQWRTIVNSSQPLSAEQAFNDSLPARLSLFNDGMLGSATDINTYEAPGTAYSPTGLEKRPREAELLFQNELCRYVPNGGEVVAANPYNDFPAAVQDLSDTHVSYLNSEYDDAVMSKWRKDTYLGEGPFDGMNGYDYIACHLGYRYVVCSSNFSYAAPTAKEATLSVSLENMGFSNSYYDFDVSITLKKSDSGQEFVFPVQTDTRLWDAETRISLKVPMKLSEFPVGDYEIYLTINDPISGFPIHLANEGEEESVSFFAGSLSLRRFPQWRAIFDFLAGEA